MIDMFLVSVLADVGQPEHTVAGLALVMVVIPPPFLWPAAGVLMVMLYGLASATRHDPRPASAAR